MSPHTHFLMLKKKKATYCDNIPSFTSYVWHLYSGMPVDVTQAILGHASQGTTAIYVQAKRQRMMEEASRFFESGGDDISGT